MELVAVSVSPWPWLLLEDTQWLWVYCLSPLDEQESCTVLLLYLSVQKIPGTEDALKVICEGKRERRREGGGGGGGCQNSM